MTSVLDMVIAGQIAQRLKLVEFVDVDIFAREAQDKRKRKSKR
jgi:hypothetical protein